jgi:hypothetical protein
VRCAYCGREAQVPQDDQDELDFLFSDVGAQTSSGSVAGVDGSGAGKADRKTGMPFGHPVRSTDPFSVIKKMAYTAAILICVIFVGKKYAWPAIEGMMEEERKSPATTVRKDEPAPPPVIKAPRSRTVGFATSDLQKPSRAGIWVYPVPLKAVVYTSPQDSEWGRSKDYDWLEEVRSDQRFETPATLELKPGDHVIVVALLYNDRGLTRYKSEGYDDIRRMLIDRSQSLAKRSRLIAEYFLPDSSTETKLVEIAGRLHIIRRYEVEVYPNTWWMLSPLFIPYQCDYVSIVNYLPRTKAFVFDEAETRDDLSIQGVRSTTDQDFIVDILKRIGTMSYQLDDGHFVLFRVDPGDGLITGLYLDDTRPRRLRTR